MVVPNQPTIPSTQPTIPHNCSAYITAALIERGVWGKWGHTYQPTYYLCYTLASTLRLTHPLPPVDNIYHRQPSQFVSQKYDSFNSKRWSQKWFCLAGWSICQFARHSFQPQVPSLRASLHSNMHYKVHWTKKYTGLQSTLNCNMFVKVLFSQL